MNAFGANQNLIHNPDFKYYNGLRFKADSGIVCPGWLFLNHMGFVDEHTSGLMLIGGATISQTFYNEPEQQKTLYSLMINGFADIDRGFEVEIHLNTRSIIISNEDFYDFGDGRYVFNFYLEAGEQLTATIFSRGKKHLGAIGFSKIDLIKNDCFYLGDTGSAQVTESASNYMGRFAVKSIYIDANTIETSRTFNFGFSFPENPIIRFPENSNIFVNSATYDRTKSSVFVVLSHESSFSSRITQIHFGV